jgi:co-chaperonin GroES (HSP10)
MEALGNKLIVQVDKADSVSRTGIQTGTAKKADRGIVISVGHLVEDPRLEIGAKVIFSEHAGKEITEGGVNYILLNYGELYTTV